MPDAAAERKEELSFMYFPTDYRWSHGVLIGLNAAPWGGAEIGEVNRIGLRLKDHIGDDKAWFREWAREAETVEKAGREHLAAGRKATGAKMLFRAANYYHVGERFLQPKSEGLAAYKRGVDCFRDAGVPSPSGTGVLYAASTGGNLFAVVVDDPGLDMTAPWPKYQHDVRNTGNPGTVLRSCP